MQLHTFERQHQRLKGMSLNVVVPPNTPDGDQPVTASYNGVATQSGALLTVQH